MRQYGTRREIHRATVVARERLTLRLVRLTLSGADLRGMRARPAQDLELLLEDGGRTVKRRYTIRRLRPDAGEIDIDMLLHNGAAREAAGRPGGRGR